MASSRGWNLLSPDLDFHPHRMLALGFKIVQIIKPRVPIVPAMHVKLRLAHSCRMIISLRWEIANRVHLSPIVKFERITDNITKGINPIPSAENIKVS
jgi:coproporphyrinogen III oxidase